MSRQQLAELDASLRAHPLTARTLEERRAAFARFMTESQPMPSGIRTVEGSLAGRRILRLEREIDPRPGVILYFHGGAWSLGSPETSAALAGELVTRTGVPAVSVDYRLAPEHPYPAGADDALAAYRALLERQDPAAIALAGDSAGGGMSVAALIGARDAGLPAPAAAVLFSPGLDMSRSGPSMTARAADDPVLTPEMLVASGALYLDGRDPLEPRLSPAVVGDLTGLPPVLVQVGTHEILLDDATRFAARARAAEVDVVLDVVAGAPHVFPMFTQWIDEADEALARAAFFLGQRMARRG